MIAVITGDVINSRKSPSALWQDSLKGVLAEYGMNGPDWELYRGDSFQLKIEVNEALLAAIHIKASFKRHSGLDVRMGIGIGSEDSKADRVTSATGQAYVLSGTCFDGLKKQTMAIATPHEFLNEILDVMLSLALLTMDTWSDTVAAVICKVIEHPQKKQATIATLMGKSQSNISEALKRGGFEEVRKLEQFYRKQISLV